MADKEQTMIPFCVYESMLSKEDTQQKRMVIIIVAEAIIILITIGLLVLNEYHWRKLWNEYDYVDDYSISAEQDGSGVNIVGGGDIDYGTEGNNPQSTEQNP